MCSVKFLPLSFLNIPGAKMVVSACHYNYPQTIVQRMCRMLATVNPSNSNQEDLYKCTEFDDLPITQYCRNNAIPLPKNVTSNQINNLKSLSFNQQISYMNYLVITESKKRKDKAKKEKAKKAKGLTHKTSNQVNHIEYGLWKNSIFAKTSKQVVLDLYYHRLASALVHNQPIIVDLGFDEIMQMKEKNMLANHLKWSIKCNRNNCNPFNLSFYNVNFESETISQLKRIMPSIFKKKIPIIISSDSYLNYYPREDLIYLTPDATEEMEIINPNAIYILGGIVDLRLKKPYTYQKAEKEGIKMQRLPLDRYLKFKGHKTLNIHTIMEILFEVKASGDWNEALKNVPRRWVKSVKDMTEQCNG